MSYSSIHNVLKDKPFGPKTMEETVEVLNHASIPSILWGNSLLDIYGVPTCDIAERDDSHLYVVRSTNLQLIKLFIH